MLSTPEGHPLSVNRIRRLTIPGRASISVTKRSVASGMAKPARLADNLAWKRRDDRSPRHRPSPTDAPPGFSGSGRASAGRRTAAICMHGSVLILGRPSLGGPVLYGPGSPERGACSPVDRCGTRRWGRGSTRSRQGGGDFERFYLGCVAEAARRGGRELDRLQAAARRIAALPGSARSRLQRPGPSRFGSR